MARKIRVKEKIDEAEGEEMERATVQRRGPPSQTNKPRLRKALRLRLWNHKKVVKEMATHVVGKVEHEEKDVVGEQPMPKIRQARIRGLHILRFLLQKET